MKTIRTKDLPNGGRRTTVELAPGEELVTVRDGHYYRIGGQVDDIFASHVLSEIKEVTWCSVSQQWVP